jgi:hypothetical protein
MQIEARFAHPWWRRVVTKGWVQGDGAEIRGGLGGEDRSDHRFLRAPACWLAAPQRDAGRAVGLGRPTGHRSTMAHGECPGRCVMGHAQLHRNDAMRGTNVGMRDLGYD